MLTIFNWEYNLEIIQAYSSPVPIIYQQCMNQIKSIVPDDIEYAFIDENLFNGEQQFSFQKGILELLIKKPDRLYMDSDMIMPKWFDFEFEKGKPYIYDGRCGMSAIYANNCPDIINDLLLKNFNPERCTHWIIRENISEFYIIPEEYIIHLHLGSLLRFAESNPNKKKVNNFDCQIGKSKSGEYEFLRINKFDIPFLR